MFSVICFTWIPHSILFIGTTEPKTTHMKYLNQFDVVRRCVCVWTSSRSFAHIQADFGTNHSIIWLSYVESNQWAHHCWTEIFYCRFLVLLFVFCRVTLNLTTSSKFTTTGSFSCLPWIRWIQWTANFDKNRIDWDFCVFAEKIESKSIAKDQRRTNKMISWAGGETTKEKFLLCKLFVFGNRSWRNNIYVRNAHQANDPVCRCSVIIRF